MIFIIWNNHEEDVTTLTGPYASRNDAIDHIRDYLDVNHSEEDLDEVDTNGWQGQEVGNESLTAEIVLNIIPAGCDDIHPLGLREGKLRAL